VSGEFQGQPFKNRNVNIQYRYLLKRNAIGTVVLVNGKSENMLKYAEVAYDLHRAGYSVFMFDHRGQGFSDHLLVPTDGSAPLEHVDDFENFVKDLNTFVETVVEKVTAGSGRPMFIVGHSMGGAIAARYIEEHPGVFSAAVLSSPMLEIHKLQLINVPGAEHLALAKMELSGDPEEPSTAPGPELSNDQAFNLPNKQVTSSRPRFDYAMSILAAHPEIKLSVPTRNWLIQAIKGGRAARSIDEVKRISTPVLMMQGTSDTFVVDTVNQTFCGRVPARACQYVSVPGGKHELLNEVGDLRNRIVMPSILTFFRNHAQ
jgi:lysophospholipase